MAFRTRLGAGVRTVRAARLALLLAATAGLAACDREAASPSAGDRVPAASVAASAVTYPDIVISQIYGGGGNSGATWTHDFVELFNPGTQPVNVGGWSVQYASSTGTSWNVSGLPVGTVIEPGRYFLVQMAVGAGGTTPLPTPDAVGTTAMAAGAGKVALSRTTAALAGSCPSGGSVVELVGYGTAANCAPTTPTLANTTAAILGGGGCAWTGNPSVDFTTGTPTPRNSASPANPCGTVEPPAEPASVTVAPATASVAAGGTAPFTATAFDAQGNAVAATFTWSTGDAAIATIDLATGVATAVAEGVVTITATTPNLVTGTAQLTVTAAPPPPAPGAVVISQVYGGGGNSGATYTHDFVELFNSGTTPVDVSGWRVHYGSPTGTTFNFATIGGGSVVQPGRYFLVQLASQAAVGVPLPTPDASSTSPNMGGVSGKVALTLPFVTLSGQCPTDAGIVDRVNYGAGNCGAVWGTTANLSNTTAALRLSDGCTSTGDVSNDFTVASVSPRNSASPAVICGGPVDPPPPPGAIVINELHADPLLAAGGASWGEWFEVYNQGTEAIDLQGWTIASAGAGQLPHIIASSVIVQPGGYAVLGRGGDFAQNGGVNLDYNYFSGSASTIWLDNTDWLLLRNASGVTVDSVRWTNASSFTRGVSRALRDPTVDNSNVDGPNWGHSTTTFGDGDYGTPGATNGTISSTPPAVPNSISFSGRLASEPPLPVGFEDQLFATLRDGEGVAVPTTWTWESVTPATASIDARGVLRALGPGTAIVRATAADGTSRTYSLPTTLGTSSTTAVYANHAEFGEPADADPSDDYILRRTEFTSSYNVTRGIPNWVSYNLEATHIGAQDRCDCFTFDEALPASFPRYNTADYTGAGAYHGYGIDRGHLVRSFDRTTADLDNAVTFLFTNIVPQTADNNQGPWAVMETYLTDLARFQNREVYVIAGVSGSLGTIKDEGLITIPSHLWKVAVIMPRDQGLADVVRYTDLEVVAVIMPNIPGIRNVDWNTYRTTVDAVEALSGYDLLALLPDHIEIAIESGTHPPVAVIGGATSGAEGSALSLDASGSSDLDGHALTFAWRFGDGATATGSSVTHTWTRDGAYTVQLVATDILGLADTTTATVNIANVAPVLAPLAGAALLPGETYLASGSFTDPGEDNWTATVDYGDGAGAQPLALDGKSFSLAHVYAAPGSYTVTVTVSDGVASASTSAMVTVGTPASALTELIAAVNQLGAEGKLSAGNTSALRTPLNAASQQVQAGNITAAANQLAAFINQVRALMQSGRLSAADGDLLIQAAQRIIDALT